MKTVLITGGSKGIGYAVAVKSLEEGARVILMAREHDGLKKAKEELIQKGFLEDRIFLQEIDLGDSESIPIVVHSIPWLAEGLDGLVNNAAAQFLKSAKTISIQEMEKTWKVNMLAPVLMIQACWEGLVKKKGSVVNVSSVAETRYEPGYSIYGGSKAFLKGFTKHLARELGYEGVKVNVVSPGGVLTPLMEIAMKENVNNQDLKKVFESIPMEQRWGKPEEIAEGIWFALFGPRYFYGEDLRIHGGLPC